MLNLYELKKINLLAASFFTYKMGVILVTILPELLCSTIYKMLSTVPKTLLSIP